MKTWWSLAPVLAAAAILAASTGAAAPAATGKADGKDLFTTYKCTTCHSIEAEKIERKKAAAKDATAATPASAKKKPDLSGVGAGKDAPWLAKYISKEVKLEEKLHPTAKFRGTPEELQTLSTWLSTLKTPAKGAKEAAAK